MMSILSGEYLPKRGQVDNLSTMYRENYYGGPLQIDARSVGASLWRSLIDQTQMDNIERGFVVSMNKDKFLTSKIHQGNGSEEVFDGLEMKKIGGSFSPHILPHGIQSLNPSIKDIAVIHSHAMPGSLDHLPTTVLSEEDIFGFISSKYHALCAVDRGGVHLLARTHKIFHNKTLDSQIVRALIAEIVKKDGGIRDVIIGIKICSTIWVSLSLHFTI